MSDKFNIKAIDQIGGHAATGFAIRAHVALLELGMGDETYGVASWDYKAVLATDADTHRIVGIITFTEQKFARDLFIYTGYVLPEWRNRGVYRSMWEEVVRQAQKAECFTISGATSVKNHDMRAVAAKLGREERTIGLTFHVPPTVKP